MTIERMRTEHLDGVARLLEQCIPSPWSRASIIGEMERLDAVCLVAEDRDTVVAFLAFERVLDEGTVAVLAVDSRYRRQGIARRMLTQAISAEDELRRVMLEVRRSNAPAVALYERMGFECVGVRAGYYDDPREDALLYTLEPVQKERL